LSQELLSLYEHNGKKYTILLLKVKLNVDQKSWTEKVFLLAYPHPYLHLTPSMKNILILGLLSVILTGCTLPWQKSNETETVVVDSSNPALPGDTTAQPTTPVDITPADTPKAIAEGGVYLPYTSTAVAQAK